MLNNNTVDMTVGHVILGVDTAKMLLDLRLQF